MASLSPTPAMRGQSIICFAKDWSEDPTSGNHVMRMLARDNRVLWFNSISTRNPDLSSRRDLAKIPRKLADFVAGAREVAPGLRVQTPLVLPFPHSAASRMANGAILKATVALLRHRLQLGEFQTWTFLPTAVDYVGTFGESLSVYYCTDEWSQFAAVDGSRVEAMEKQLCGKVDLVFATSQTLVDRKRPYNQETHLASHGVDHAHFATALSGDTAVAPELRDVPRPIIGFFGLVEEWIDVELFEYLARNRPDWSIVVIGRSMRDLSALRSLPNVFLIDRRPYETLPQYAKAFSVGLCPFRISELTRHVNPIKLREYLSAGLPVVSSDIPECRVRQEWGRVARTHPEFLARIEEVLREDTPARRRARSDDMRGETWDHKVAAIGAHVMRVLDEKRARQRSPRHRS